MPRDSSPRTSTFADQHTGWVFVGFSDENVRPWLRPGTVRLWDDARTIAKREGEFVLFLQLGRSGARWVGAGRIVGPEARWKAFGVEVRCTRVLAPGLLAVPGLLPSKLGSSDENSPARLPPEEAWENRELAAVIGVHRFRARTPFLDAGRDLRLTGSDLRLLIALQPELAGLLEASGRGP